MRRFLPKRRYGWKLFGGAMIAVGLTLWVAAADAADGPASANARLGIVIGGAMTVAGIAAIGASQQHHGTWYDNR